MEDSQNFTHMETSRLFAEEFKISFFSFFKKKHVILSSDYLVNDFDDNNWAYNFEKE